MSPVEIPKKPGRCPICRKQSADAYRPFCSKRCADIDLGKWFSGGYAIAGREEHESDPSTVEEGDESPEKSGA